MAALHGAGQSLKIGALAFKTALPSVLIFEILYKAATYVIVRPLMSMLMQLLLYLSGYGLAFNEDILHFATSIPGITAIILLTALSLLLVYFEFAVLIALLRQAMENKPPALRDAFVQAIWSFGSLKGTSTALFSLYALVLLPIIQVGVTSSLIPRLTIPNFITGELYKTFIGKIGLWSFSIVLVLLFFSLIFVLPAMVLDHCRFSKAARKSFSVIGAYKLRILSVIMLVILIWGLLFILPRQAFILFFGSTSVGFADVFTLYGLSLRTPVLLLVWLLANLLQILQTPIILAFLTACYFPLSEHKAPGGEELERLGDRFDALTGWLQRGLLFLGSGLRELLKKIEQRPFVKKHKKLLTAILAAAILLCILITGSYPGRMHDPIIIGHRGSGYGVENTLSAVSWAIGSGADYAEVDILLSKDGVPMVIHDANLQRLSGRNVNVYELTAQELQALVLAQNGEAGQIPTLQEVVDYCEGRILLAVELKLHGREQEDIIKQVMQIIGASEYQEHCIFLSMDYELIARLQREYPDYIAGYCVYGNVGTPTTSRLLSLNVDFLLVEESMASKSFVRRCSKSRIPVYVWTVNSESRMREYLEIGVSGLITDYPDVGTAVLEELYGAGGERIGPYGKESSGTAE